MRRILEGNRVHFLAVRASFRFGHVSCPTSEHQVRSYDSEESAEFRQQNLAAVILS